MSLLNTTAKALTVVLLVAYVMIFLKISDRPDSVKPIQVPVVEAPKPAPKAPVQLSLGSIDFKSMECLAMNIYHEARNESEKGQIAVALVTKNRVEDDRFPDTYCGVVRQGKITSWRPATHKWQCQFTWFCDGKPDDVKNKTAWGTAVRIAYEVMYSDVKDFTHGATHYHASYVRPYWRRDKQLTKIKRVDTHIFYRWEQRA